MSDSTTPATRGTNFISNGSRGARADILMDGASMTNFEPNGGITQATYTPSPEAVEEFKVEQSNFSAEYGFSGASVVNMVTRSGTNKFHGSAYDFIRNQITDANNWFNNHYGIPSLRCIATTTAAPSAGRSSRTRLSSSLTTTDTRNHDEHIAGRRSQRADAQRRFRRSVRRAGRQLRQQRGCAAWPAGQIWDPYSGTYNSTMGGRGTAAPSFPTTIWRHTPARAVPTAGTTCSRRRAPGNLIDPVAQKMMNLFPAAKYLRQRSTTTGSAPGPNQRLQRPVRHQGRPPFQRKEPAQREVFAQWNHGTPFNCFKNFTDPCAGGPN